MRYSFVLGVVFLVFFSLVIVISCAQNPVIEEKVIDVYTTNYIVRTNYTTNIHTNNLTNIITNTYQVINITNTNYITNEYSQTIYVYGLSSNVSFSLVNIGEGAVIQPYYQIDGILEGFSYNDVDKFFIYVTNNGFSNNFVFSTLSNFSGIISAPGYNKVYAYITLISKLNSSYTIGLNLNISNIPRVEITSIDKDFIVTFGDTNIHGYVDISTPDSISSILVIVSNASGSVTTNIPTTNEGSSWTNVVRRIMFYSLPNLLGGYNYVRVVAISSSGIQGVSRTITILKSLFTVDGLYDSLWNNARLVATATSVNPYFGWGIGSMRVTNDDFYLYIFVSNLNVPNLGDNGLKLSISIDTNSPSGLSNDAWVGANQRGRFVYLPTNGNYPDIQIHIRLKQTNQINGAGVYLAVVGATSYWTNIANTWTPGMDKGVMFGVNNAIGWEVAIPLSLINVPRNTTLRFIAVLGKPDGDEKNSAIHVLPADTLNEITTSDGFFTNIIRVWSSDYTIY